MAVYIGHDHCIGKGRGAKGRVWLTGNLEFVPLNVVQLYFTGTKLVLECCDGLMLLDLVIEVHVEGIDRHACSLS